MAESALSLPTGTFAGPRDPQCNTLLDDGTRCSLKGTHGDPKKTDQRCKAHNTLYQDAYRAYKAAGKEVMRVKNERRSSQIPSRTDVKQIKSLSSLSEVEDWLKRYRKAILEELRLRKLHTTQFMPTPDEGHTNWVLSLEEDVEIINSCLKSTWVRRSEIGLEKRRRRRRKPGADAAMPSNILPLPANIAVPRSPENISLGHQHGGSHRPVSSVAAPSTEPVLLSNQEEPTAIAIARVNPFHQGVETGRIPSAPTIPPGSENRQPLGQVFEGHQPPASHPSPPRASQPNKRLNNQQGRPIPDYGGQCHTQPQQSPAYCETRTNLEAGQTVHLQPEGMEHEKASYTNGAGRTGSKNQQPSVQLSMPSDCQPSGSRFHPPLAAQLNTQLINQEGRSKYDRELQTEQSTTAGNEGPREVRRKHPWVDRYVSNRPQIPLAAHHPQMQKSPYGQDGSFPVVATRSAVPTLSLHEPRAFRPDENWDDDDDHWLWDLIKPPGVWTIAVVGVSWLLTRKK